MKTKAINGVGSWGEEFENSVSVQRKRGGEEKGEIHETLVAKERGEKKTPGKFRRKGGDTLFEV